MKFKSLKIEVPEWGENKGKVVAEIVIGGRKSAVTMVLPDETAGRILQMAKQAVIDGVEDAANDFIFELTTEIPDTLSLANTQP